MNAFFAELLATGGLPFDTRCLDPGHPRRRAARGVRETIPARQENSGFSLPAGQAIRRIYELQRTREFVKIAHVYSQIHIALGTDGMNDRELILARQLSPRHSEAVARERFHVKPSVLRDLLFSCLRQCGYESPKIDEASGTATAIRALPIPPPLAGTRRTALTVNWFQDEQDEDSTVVAWIAVDQSPGSRGSPDRRATEEVGQKLRNAVQASFLGSGSDDRQVDPVARPGQAHFGPYAGNLRDYSGFATEDETSDLTTGVLPLGRYAFDRSVDETYRGQDLFLSADDTGTRERRGILVCAPQNSGKTTLLVRWARAANQAGYNLFLVDVKGNLRRRLGDLQGEVYLFSTDPDEMESDRINFLAGLDPMTAKGSERIRDLVSALLPRTSSDTKRMDDDFQRHHRNWVVWLTALIHLVKLREVYLPHHFLGEDQSCRAADLNDLYELAVDENVLYDYVTVLREAEFLRRSEGEPMPHCGVDHWVREALHLLDPRKSPPRYCLASGDVAALDEKVSEEVKASLQSLDGGIYGTEDLFRLALEEVLPGETFSQLVEPLVRIAQLPGEGEREAVHGYRDYTQAIVTALEPFAKHGTLFHRIRSQGTGRQFTLEQLDREDAQVTIILAAREQDQEKATTVLAAAMRRILHLMLDRVKRPAKDRSILLLLDETRRIPGFEPHRYITLAREAEAGCVIVYQSLDQIGDDRAIGEILENVGTQVYLGSLVGNTARYFLANLPRRIRSTATEQYVYSMDGRTRTLSLGHETVEYVTTNELFVLPAGRRAALVYLNDIPRRKPILVDLQLPQITETDRRPVTAKGETNDG